MQKVENKYLCNCNICGHQWLTRNDSVPRRCANVECQSFKWNKEEPKEEAPKLMDINDIVMNQTEDDIQEMNRRTAERDRKEREEAKRRGITVEELIRETIELSGKQPLQKQIVEQPKPQQKQIQKPKQVKKKETKSKCPKCESENILKMTGYDFDKDYSCQDCNNIFEVNKI